MQNAVSFFAMASPETQLLTIVSEDLQTNCFVTIEAISMSVQKQKLKKKNSEQLKKKENTVRPAPKNNNS